jgi:hypothetical protein
MSVYGMAFAFWSSCALSEPATTALRSPADFAGIADRNARSIAYFEEAAKVIQHPRCLNCHPDSDTPTQTDLMRTHRPAVTRGRADAGASGMPCSTCHHDTNFDVARVPGRAGWRLAPRSAAWVGRTVSDICMQLKDSKRNGGKDTKALIHHVSADHFVGWAWEPGADRSVPPGTQREFAALIRAWLESGAACPTPSK